MPPENKPDPPEPPQRASHRIAVSLPLLLRGRDIHGAAFEDTTHSFNLSREGASFLTRRELREGQKLELVIPQRPPGRTASSRLEFETIGEVRRVVPKGPGEWEVGVHFVGPRLRTYMPETS